MRRSDEEGSNMIEYWTRDADENMSGTEYFTDWHCTACGRTERGYVQRAYAKAIAHEHSVGKGPHPCPYVQLPTVDTRNVTDVYEAFGDTLNW